ncbi:zinc finger protein CONSTANS-LIKE 2-like [Apium graveolens]|uniref:zinc finger protein CONSTANS-LIKE 2-like n=1 Tax=Apium graveolens TaxID=4045 RepID=UPI003D7A4088
MSSDISVYDASFFSSGPFSPYNDSVSIKEILQTLPDNEKEMDEIANSLFSSSSSPPNHQMQNLSISHVGNPNGFTDFTVPNVKTEEFQNLFGFSSGYGSSFGTSVGECENAVKMMQRSFSSNNNRFEGKPRFLCQPQFIGSSGFNNQDFSSLDNSSSVKIRKVCSTGDLQSIKTRDRLSCSPLGTEKCYIEEANTKVVKYSAEERKERIERYRAKRAQRNFNKTIKYQCRKTLADNRPRIRGRFARNDEALGVPRTPTFNRYDEEDDYSWAEAFRRGDESNGASFNNSGSSQLQCYLYQ